MDRVSYDRLAARLRHMPGDGVFSGCTAAWLHGLDLPPCDPVEVTLPRLSTTSHMAGVRLTRSDFTPAEAAEVRGLPVTSGTRTVADLVRRSSATEGVVVLDMALRARLVTADDLREWVDRHARHRGSGRILRAIDVADAASESLMESRLRALLVMSGLPRPLVQKSICDASGAFIARPDLLYPPIA